MEKFKSIVKVLIRAILVITTLCSVVGYYFLTKLFAEGSVANSLMFTSGVLQIVILLMTFLRLNDFEKELKQDDDWSGFWFMLGYNIQPIVVLIGSLIALIRNYVVRVKKEIAVLPRLKS